MIKRELTIVMYYENKEIDSIGMKDYLAKPENKDKTIKQLSDEMKEKNIKIKFENRRIV